MTQEKSTAQSLIAITFLLIPIALAIVIVGLFGGLSALFFPEMTFWNAFWGMNLIAGTGWLLYFIIVWLAMDTEIKGDYLGYLIPAVLLPGLIFLTPYILYQLFAVSSFALLPLIVIGGSLVVMFWRHYRKLQFLNLSLVWFVIWIVCLTLPALGWLWYFREVTGWI